MPVDQLHAQRRLRARRLHPPDPRRREQDRLPPPDRIIFEFTETEKLDASHLLDILNTYRAIGFRTAIDDFGAGHAGLQLLARFQPNIVKIDMDLVRGIDVHPVKRAILRHTLRLMEELGITPLCEGVEPVDELNALQDLGVRLIQGYLLAKPAFETLVTPVLPERGPRAAAARRASPPLHRLSGGLERAIAHDGSADFVGSHNRTPRAITAGSVR